MIFLKSLSAEDLTDTIRANDPIRENVKLIRGLLLQKNLIFKTNFVMIVTLRNRERILLFQSK